MEWKKTQTQTQKHASKKRPKNVQLLVQVCDCNGYEQNLKNVTKRNEKKDEDTDMPVRSKFISAIC